MGLPSKKNTGLIDEILGDMKDLRDDTLDFTIEGLAKNQLAHLKGHGPKLSDKKAQGHELYNLVLVEKDRLSKLDALLNQKLLMYDKFSQGEKTLAHLFARVDKGRKLILKSVQPIQSTFQKNMAHLFNSALKKS